MGSLVWFWDYWGRLKGEGYLAPRIDAEPGKLGVKEAWGGGHSCPSRANFRIPPGA